MHEKIKSYIGAMFNKLHDCPNPMSKEGVYDYMYAYLSGLTDGDAISVDEFLIAIKKLDEWKTRA